MKITISINRMNKQQYIGFTCVSKDTAQAVAVLDRYQGIVTLSETRHCLLQLAYKLMTSLLRLWSAEYWIYWITEYSLPVRLLWRLTVEWNLSIRFRIGFCTFCRSVIRLWNLEGKNLSPETHLLLQIVLKMQLTLGHEILMFFYPLSPHVITLLITLFIVKSLNDIIIVYYRVIWYQRSNGWKHE